MSAPRASWVLCAGLTTLDVVHQITAPPRWGRKERSVGGELVAGGPAANAAVTAARLLGGARLVTAIGDGPGADAVRADLAAHQVQVTDLAPPSWPLPVASALVDVHTGERTVISPGALGGRGVTVGGQESDTAPDTAADTALDGVLDEPVRDAAAVLLDGHHPALATRLATLAQRAGVPVLLDAGSWKEELAPVLPRITVAACSADFQPPGLPPAGADPHRAATLLHRRGVPTVLVTDGPRPVVWSTMDGERGTVPVPEVRAADTLGAGDVFHGALAASVAAGHRPLTWHIEFASRVAALRCARLGARSWLDDGELNELATSLFDRSAHR